MRSTISKALAALAITAIAAFAADNSLGTWKLNLDKSKFGPGPMPVKSLTVVREASDGGVKVTITGQQADGAAINAGYSAKYDGSESKVTGNAPYDTVSIKQANANTFTDQRKKTGGPYQATGRTVISGGGKVMTTTAKGAGTDGKPFTSSFVLEKQ